MNKNNVFEDAEPRFGKDLLEVLECENIRLDIKYAGPDNFMKKDLYQGFDRAFLHRLAFDKLMTAKDQLKISSPELSFLIFDCLRPRSVQSEMYQFLAGTAFQEYVASPEAGSLHNFGMAIDLTLCDKNGKELDMGTPFDDFESLAQPRLEELFLSTGQLSQTQHENRLILRRVMLAAGFEQLPHEWWHYNAFPAEQVRGHFLIVE